MQQNLSDAADLIIQVEGGNITVVSTSGRSYRVAVVDFDAQGDSPTHVVQLTRNVPWLGANVEMLEASHSDDVLCRECRR